MPSERDGKRGLWAIRGCVGDMAELPLSSAPQHRNPQNAAAFIANSAPFQKPYIAIVSKTSTLRIGALT